MKTSGDYDARGVRWDLSDLHAAPDDPAIERLMKDCLRRARAFEKKYRGAVASLSARRFAAMLKTLESITAATAKTYCYAQLLHASNTDDPKAGALLQFVREKRSGISGHLLFFDVEWVRAPDAAARKLLGSRELAPYRHFLTTKRLYKPHTLSEKEERVVMDKSVTGASAFKRLFDEILADMRFDVKTRKSTKKLNETATLSLLYSPDRDTRKAAARALTRGLEKNSKPLTFIFNTLVADHWLDDNMRAYETPISSRNLSNEIDDSMVEGLLAECEANYGMVSRYYRFKKKLLGLPSFADYDRYAPVSASRKKTSYPDARRMVLESLGKFSPEMAAVARLFFTNNWIDAECRNGKYGGAFSHPVVPSAHPYILMNYQGGPRDVMTLAHEMGHGIHQYLSRKKGYFLSDAPLTTAETASVFSEMLVFQEMKRRAPKKDRLALLCGKIEECFATVFRQTVMTRFEQSLHESRRSEGELTKERISELWTAANRAMFGSSVNLTRDYGLWWIYVPHFIHSPFYCYSYSFGELLALSLYDEYTRRGGDFVSGYLDLLSSGGSDSPAALVRKTGVDITAPGFWAKGFSILGDMVDEAVSLA
ncbi:MAG: M3 family oligoendopeptidase [Candidatus Dadabacteria bacterium]|nr:M3 family oligoendopeptidase [Candidatus Dadabacteria bacterium]